MRYFRRGEGDCVVRDGNGMERFVKGPDPEAGQPGGRIAYDDTDPQQAKYADAMAVHSGWHEETKDGTPIPRPKRQPVVTPPTPEEVALAEAKALAEKKAADEAALAVASAPRFTGPTATGPRPTDPPADTIEDLSSTDDHDDQPDNG